MWANMAIFLLTCVSRDTRCRYFSRVDELSTDTLVLERHIYQLKIIKVNTIISKMNHKILS